MAYYTGSVNSFAELLTALQNACTANGWVLSSGILSKGRAFVKPSVSAVALGLQIEGGTGQSGASLINPSPQAPRLGAPGPYSNYYGAVTWPSTYHIHVGINPDEVYVVLNTNVTDFYWLAFGLSTVPMLGTGLWMAASAPKNNTGSQGGIIINEAGANSANSYYFAPSLFWNIYAPWAGSEGCAIQRDASGAWPLYTPVGAASLAPLVNRYELTWNKAAVLLPAREYEAVAENKRRLLIDAAHARIVRLGSLEPGQILQLGAEKWRIYPFYRKNTTAPNGANNHTGTFGMALRYDGP